MIRLIADGTALTTEPGGSRVRFLALFSALARRDGITVTALIRRGSGLADALRAAGIDCRFVRRSAAAAARGMDGLFCAETLPLPRLGPMPILATLHDLRYLHHRWASFPRRVYARTRLRGNLRRAKRVIVVSRTTGEELARSGLLSGQPIRVVPNAPAPFPDLTEERAALLRERLGARVPYLLSLARFEKRKNVPFLVDAFEAFLRRGRREERLVLAGSADGPDGGAVVERIAASPLLRERVVLAGTLRDEERAALLAGAAGFVQSSLYEGFGMGIIEAMECGVPVACSAIPAHREAGGGAALYFDPCDREDAAGLFERLGSDPDRVAAGREQATCFSWDRSAALFEEIVRTL